MGGILKVLNAMVARNARLLIVADQIFNMEIIQSVLFYAGYRRLSLAHDLWQATQHLASRQYDIVFLDITQSASDSIKLVNLAKKSKFGHKKPKTIVTAGTDEYSLSLAIASGADSIIIKPFNIMELLNEVNSLVDNNFAQISAVSSPIDRTKRVVVKGLKS
ncbi:MAG: response regulator [Magnetococcales bacterium]|nr:response regulator [Magnetococcales bacterium]